MIGTVLMLTSGCATLFTGTTQKVAIDSYPQGAEIIVDGRSKGITPAIVKLKKDPKAFLDGGKEINLLLEGYTENPYEIGTELNPVAILNFTNIPFWVVDGVTGAAMRYEKNANFNLQPLPPEKKSDTERNPDKYKQLEALKRLLDQGTITEDEFVSEKSKILNNGQVKIVN